MSSKRICSCRNNNSSFLTQLLRLLPDLSPIPIATHPLSAVLNQQMTATDLIQANAPLQAMLHTIIGKTVPFGTQRSIIKRNPACFASCAVRPDTRLAHARSRSSRSSSKTAVVTLSSRTVGRSATNGMASQATAMAVPGCMCASSVVLPPTTPKHARLLVSDVPLSFIPAAWQELFARYGLSDDFSDILQGFHFGFSTGVHTTLTQTITPPNHNSALKDPNVISKYIQNKLQLSRYSGTFSCQQLFHLLSHFCTLPLGLVPKANFSQHCVIQDLLFPQNNPNLSSVNFEIDSDDFPCSCRNLRQLD